MVRWIFFDIGNVIMNDDAVMAYLYAELFAAIRERGVEMSFADLLSEREEVIATSGAGHWSVLAEKYLGAKGHQSLGESSREFLRDNYLDYHNVLPGIEDALEELASSYSLAVVANQMSAAESALESVGLRNRFEFLALSENLGVAKPEPALFRWALVRADCQPSEAVMVGDRIDNDILPARRLGLGTVWFHVPHRAKGMPLRDDFRRLYLDSQERRSTASIGPSQADEEPDGVARSPEELVAAIEAFALSE